MVVEISMFKIPGQHDGSVKIQIVYTATKQTDFMRIIPTK
jgi:hypothetical protein